MRFLVDNALSPVVARGLRALGYDAVHVRDLGLAAASDPVVMGRARQDGRIVLSADTDFSALLARSRGRSPSLLLFRHGAERRPDLQVRLLREVLPRVADALEAGAVVTVEPLRVRVRPLPLTGGPDRPREDGAPGRLSS